MDRMGSSWRTTPATHSPRRSAGRRWESSWGTGRTGTPQMHPRPRLTICPTPSPRLPPTPYTTLACLRRSPLFDRPPSLSEQSPLVIHALCVCTGQQNLRARGGLTQRTSLSARGEGRTIKAVGTLHSETMINQAGGIQAEGAAETGSENPRAPAEETHVPRNSNAIRWQ